MNSVLLGALLSWQVAKQDQQCAETVQEQPLPCHAQCCPLAHLAGVSFPGAPQLLGPEQLVMGLTPWCFHAADNRIGDEVGLW